MPKGPFPPLPENPVLDICPPDVILAGDSEEDSPSERQAQGKRILKHAERYLRGETLYIHSARLRGPVVKNPWAKPEPKNKRQAGRMMENRLKVTKRWKPTADPDNGKEILATPTQVHGWGKGANGRQVVAESPEPAAPPLRRHGWAAINEPKTPPPIMDPPIIQTRPAEEADAHSVFSNDNVSPVATPGKRSEKLQFGVSPELSSAPLSPTDFYKRSAPKPTPKPPEQIPRPVSRSKSGLKERAANGNAAPLATVPRSTGKHDLGIEDHDETGKPTAAPAPKRLRMKVDFSKMSPFAFTERKNNHKRKRKRTGVVGQGSGEANRHAGKTTEPQMGGAHGMTSEEPLHQKDVASASQTCKDPGNRPEIISRNTDVPSGTQGKHGGDTIILGPAPSMETPKFSGPIDSIGHQLLINYAPPQLTQPPLGSSLTSTMIPAQPKSSPREANSEKPLADGADLPARPTVSDDTVPGQPELGICRDGGKVVHPGAPEVLQSTQTQLSAARRGFYDAMMESPFAFRSNLDSTAEGAPDVLRPDAFFDDAKRTPKMSGIFTGGWGNRGRAKGVEDLLFKTPAPRASNLKPSSVSEEQPRRIPPISLAAGAAMETPKPPNPPGALTFTPFSAFETPVKTHDSKREEGISPLTFSPLRDATQPADSSRRSLSAKKSVKFAGFGLLDDGDDGNGDDGADEDTASSVVGFTRYIDNPKKGQQAEDAKEDLLKEVMGFMGNDLWDIDEELKKMAAANPKSDRKGNSPSTIFSRRRQWR